MPRWGITQSRSDCVARRPGAQRGLDILETRSFVIRESQRDSVPKPRVAATRLPWVIGKQTFPTATRLRHIRWYLSPICHNAVGVDSISGRQPKVGADAPTLG